MKKYCSILIIILALFTVGCTSDNVNYNLEKISLSEVKESYELGLKEIKDGKYNNLKIDSIKEYDYEDIDLYEFKSKYQEFYEDDFNKTINELPDMFRFLLEDENLKVEDIYDVNTQAKYNELNSKLNKESENVQFVYSDETRYVQLNPAFSLLWLNKGQLKEVYGEKLETAYLPWAFESIETLVINEDLDLNKKYKLYDGEEVSLNEAKEYVEKYFNEEFKYNQYGNEVDLQAYEIEVLKIEEDKYAYRVYLKTRYNNIPFAEYKNGKISKTLENQTIKTLNNDVLLIGNENIDFYVLQLLGYEIQDKEEVKNIISLQEALKIVEENITTTIEFTIEDLGIHYLSKIDEGYDITYPVWKVKLKNNQDNLKNEIYINAENGSFLIDIYSELSN